MFTCWNMTHGVVTKKRVLMSCSRYLVDQQEQGNYYNVLHVTWNQWRSSIYSWARDNKNTWCHNHPLSVVYPDDEPSFVLWWEGNFFVWALSVMEWHHARLISLLKPVWRVMLVNVNLFLLLPCWKRDRYKIPSGRTNTAFMCFYLDRCHDSVESFW